MKTIWHVSSEDEGEIEGIFDENGELLGMWCCNDAHWRNEYFSPFMKGLGIEVKTNWRDPIYQEMKQKLEEHARSMWG
jgi:hypothetical protein